jgi:hypothetical protein
MVVAMMKKEATNGHNDEEYVQIGIHLIKYK